MDWEKAEKHLKKLIDLYKAIGPNGAMGLTMTLYPLNRRLQGGERTQGLYDEIMACE